MKIFTHLTTLLTGLVFAVGTAWADVPFSTTTLLADETSTDETTITVDVTTGTATQTDGTVIASTATDFFRYWTSTATDPQVKLDAGYNNMRFTDSHIQAWAGQHQPQTYTISTSAGYIITGYTFDFVWEGSTSITVTGGDQELTSSSTSQTLSVSGLTESTATFILSGSSKGIILSNFKVTVKDVLYTNFQEAIETAKTALNTRGVGYPTTESSAYSALQSAITDAEKLTEETVTADDLTTLETAITTYMATTDIQMPEDGKAYTISFKMYDGSTRLMYLSTSSDASGSYELITDGSEATTEQKEAAILVCRKTSDGNYVFVNNKGGYLVWKGSGTNSYQIGNNSNRGWQDSYSTNADYCTFTISKIVEGDNVTTGTQEALLGCVAMSAAGRPSYGNNNPIVYFVSSASANSSTGSYYDGATGAFYSSTHSSALLIEEATYPNTVTLNSTGGTISGANYLGTFSAPFPTVIPTGVSAYYVASTKNASDETALATAVTTQIETAIPANTGVLLVSDSETSATMVPVAGETIPTIEETNMLGHSAGAAMTIDADNSTVYILSKTDTYGVGFYLATSGTTLAMNKSYLNYTAGNATAIALNFDGKSTDITNATSNASDNAPVYDLSGRRVQKAMKGGLYISNGKKFIVK